MGITHRLLFTLMIFATASLLQAQTSDPIRATVDRAIAARSETRAKAKADLLKVIDDQIKTAGNKGDLEALKLLTSQKDQLVAAGVTPTAPSLKDPSAAYDQAVRAADGRLVVAFESAIDEYNSRKQFAEALQIKTLRGQLLAGQEPVADGQARSPESIATSLAQSKQAYRQGVIDAKAALVQAIDARIASAVDAGDLKTVNLLRTIRPSAASDGVVSAEITDPATITAKNRFISTIQALNTRLSQNFSTAIRDYTRARKFDEATAVQNEFAATGLSQDKPVAPGAAAPEPIRRLAKILPPTFETSDAYTVVKEGGIRPKNGTMVLSKRKDFLAKDKDFVFDIWFQMEKQNGENAFVGVGSGREGQSIGIVFRAIGGYAPGPFLVGGASERLTEFHEAGTYIIRVEHLNGALTLAIGQEKNGNFDTIATRTIASWNNANPNLDERVAHLFFGGGVTFLQYRLTEGAGAAAASSPTNIAGPGNAAAPPFKIVNLNPPATATLPVTSTTPAVPPSGSSPSNPATPPPPASSPKPAPPAGTPTTGTPTGVTPPPVAGAQPPATGPATPNPNSKLAPGLAADIYSGSGFERLVTSRIDSQVVFQWRAGVPPEPGVSTPHYSILWTGVIVIPAKGEYLLGLSADDSASLNIDGNIVASVKKPGANFSKDPIPAGPHTIVLRYQNKMAEGKIHLAWKLKNDVHSDSVPPEALLHLVVPPGGNAAANPAKP